MQERLTFDSRLRGAAAVRDTSAAVEHDLEELSIRFDDVEARRALLGEEAGSATDAAILGAFRDRFQQQIDAYGLGRCATEPSHYRRPNAVASRFRCKSASVVPSSWSG